MSIRKERIHFTGSANTDRKTSPDAKNIRSPRSALHSPKNSYSEHALRFSLTGYRSVETSPKKRKQKYIPPRPDPNARTNAKYKPPNALFGVNLQLAPKKRLLCSSRSADNLKLVPNEKKLPNLTNAKEYTYKTAAQETQLVRIKPKESLEGKVDLRKVADIRRTIRRRYANQTNFRKIFNYWDINGRGIIDTADVYAMIQRFGISINMNEARALVAASDSEQRGYLDLNAFMELIFNDDEQINVQLSQIRAPSAAGSDRSSHSVEDNIAQIAVARRAADLQNQLKDQLTVRYPQLQSVLTKEDKFKTGKIMFGPFATLLQQEMNIPNALVGDKELKSLFIEMGGNFETGMNYKELLDQVRTQYKNLAMIPETYQNSIFNKTKPSTEIPQQFDVINTSDAPINVVEKIGQKSRFVRKHLRDTIENQNEFKTHLKSYEKNGVISQEDLRQFLLDEMHDKPNQNIGKGELEAFLSQYAYNNHSQISVQDLINNVYQDEASVMTQLTNRLRRLPPQKEGVYNVEWDKGQITNLLNSIDEHVFSGKTNQYQVFKKFDVDNDGYISESDLAAALTALKIPNKSTDATQLMSFLDKNRNGYIDFQEFWEQIRPNTVGHNAKALGIDHNLLMNISQPSAQYIAGKFAAESEAETAKLTTISKFLPETSLLQTVKSVTRFTGRPQHKDTFYNYQPSRSASMSISEAERFTPKNWSPINFAENDRLSRISRRKGGIGAMTAVSRSRKPSNL